MHKFHVDKPVKHETGIASDHDSWNIFVLKYFSHCRYCLSTPLTLAQLIVSNNQSRLFERPEGAAQG